MGLSLSEHERCLNKKQLQSRKQRSILGALIGDSALINQLSSNMQLAIRTQDENFARIKDLDQSIVSHVNTLLENEITHDKDIRTVFHLMKAMGHFIDNANSRAVFYNLRFQQGEYIKYELSSIAGELDILKDALHHKVHCDFNQCIVSRHLCKFNSTDFLLTEQIQMQKLNTHYQILCQPVSNKKISYLHMKTGHKIDKNNLILNSGKRIDIGNLINETFINSELQFISAEMLVVGESPR